VEKIWDWKKFEIKLGFQFETIVRCEREDWGCFNLPKRLKKHALGGVRAADLSSGHLI